MPRSAGEKSPAKMLSRSVPTSPKNQHDLTKSNTLPPPRVTATAAGQGSAVVTAMSAAAGGSGSASASPRKSRSHTLSSFLRKLSPRLRPGSGKSRDKTWCMVEIAQADVDGQDARRHHHHHQSQVSAAPRKSREGLPSDTAAVAGTPESRQSPTPAVQPASGGSSATSTPSKTVSSRSAKAGPDEKQAPKKLLQETTSKQQGAQHSPQQTIRASVSTKERAREKVQPVNTFVSQPLIRINSTASPSQSDIPLPGTRIRRIHQPPRTLNILNKIVVHPPEVEKVKGKMASVESIGSCSLDVDATASESSGTADGRTSSVSQHTLQSASIDFASGTGSLSLQGAVLDTGHSPRSHSKITTTAEITGAVPTTSVPEVRYVSELYIPNGQFHNVSEDGELSDQRKPSYINISCSVSGYTSYSCYNSKVREELRSRDNSPARLAFSSETNHVQSLRSMDHLHTLDLEVTKGGNIKTSPSKKITPTKLHTSSIMLHVNSNGSDVVDRASRLSLYEEKRSSVWRTSSEDGILSHQGHTVFTKRQEVCREYKDANGSVSVQGTNHESSEIIDSNNNDHDQFQNNGASLKETKSLIQQRIERLYGPGALAQGFRIHRERKDSASSEATCLTALTPKHDFKDNRNPITSEKLIHSASPLKAYPISHHFAPQRHSNGSVYPDEFMKLTNDENQLVKSKRTNGDLKNEQALLISDGHLTKELPITSERILSSSVRNGKWFIDVMNNEKAKIESLIAKSEQILNNEVLSEDNCGRIRAAIGKANLLLTQKFLQFKGLCEKNLTQSADEPFPTTIEDLAGFWDMVLIQVEDIYGMFDAIERAQQNRWIFDEVDVISVTKDKGKPSTVPYSTNSAPLLSIGTSKSKKSALRKPVSSGPQRSAKSEEAVKAREEARRRLLEAKRKGRHQTASQVDNSGIEIYVPEDK